MKPAHFAEDLFVALLALSLFGSALASAQEAPLPTVKSSSQKPKSAEVTLVGVVDYVVNPKVGPQPAR